MRARQHRASFNTGAHVAAIQRRLQHQRLPQGGLAVTQPTFFQPTAALDKVLQGKLLSTAPFQRCAQLHCRRRQPPAASTLHTHRAACRTPNPATSHHTHPKRADIGGNAAHSATPAAIVRTLQQPAPPLHMPPLCTQQSTSSASAAAARKGCHAKQHLLTSADITCDAAAATAATKLTSRQCQERRQHIGSCHRHAGSQLMPQHHDGTQKHTRAACRFSSPV